MIAFPAGTKVWIAGGVTDMRRGMNTLALAVQQGLGRDPHAGEIFCFRGRKGDLVKLLWHDGVGMSLYVKRWSNIRDLTLILSCRITCYDVFDDPSAEGSVVASYTTGVTSRIAE